MLHDPSFRNRITTCSLFIDTFVLSTHRKVSSLPFPVKSVTKSVNIYNNHAQQLAAAHYRLNFLFLLSVKITKEPRFGVEGVGDHKVVHLHEERREPVSPVGEISVRQRPHGYLQHSRKVNKVILLVS